MGSMDHPVWWDEEMAATYHMENRHTARITLIISYAVKQYLKLDKLQMLSYLPACIRLFISSSSRLNLSSVLGSRLW
jgi:hypothetical protein